nr:SPX domain-containing protein 4 [Tanacetum cinerariifolium]
MILNFTALSFFFIPFSVIIKPKHTHTPCLTHLTSHINQAVSIIFFSLNYLGYPTKSLVSDGSSFNSKTGAKRNDRETDEKSGKDGMFTSESEFSDEMMAIQRDFVTIHGEILLLKNYSSLNFAGTTCFLLIS